MTYFESRPLFLDQPANKGVSTASGLLNFREPLMDVFTSYVDGKKIIDLGCNNGRWSSWFLDKGATFVEGVDMDNDFIVNATSLMSNYFASDKYKFTTENLISYTPSTSFDLAALFNTLHYEAPFDQINHVCSYVNTVLVEMGDSTENVINPNSFYQGDFQTEINPPTAKAKFINLGFNITELSTITNDLYGSRARFVAIKSS